MKKIAAIVLGLSVLAGFAYYILILQISSLDRSLYAIDLDQVRKLATETEGALPIAVNAEAPAQVVFPAAAVVTGWGWSAHTLPIYAYQVVFPRGHVMIDSAMSAEQASAMGDAPFDSASYDRLVSALGNARQIVFTYPEGALDGYEPLSYDRMYALAPGIVLIEATGHTPGSQIVYVRLQNAQEYLFIGDVAWHYAGINLVRPRPNLVSRFFLGEDRPRTHAQVAELKSLEAENPGLAIIVGHDAGRTKDQMESGLLGNRFQ